ncbi:hypothetical protein Tco_0682707 [Tanacetum coccineum]|uniref:Integrase, catalytic region, zinc finger, CCHC-type, peptidase aspartic, catalytic n=1 Tax=Tanacetum coccineum TaxID=301880 RepID=A0ABQ4XTM1_9ASTR
MGKFRETLAKGALHLGPKQDRVFVDLTPEEKDRYKANIRATNILLQGLPKDIYTHINHYTDAKDIWDNVKMLLEGSELTKDKRESQLYDEFKHFRQNKGETIYEYYIRVDRTEFRVTMQGEQLQLENGVVLDEEQLLFIAGRQDNAFDAYVDEPPTMFMAILSSVYPIYDEAGLSYDSNILSKVQDHDNCQDIVVCAEQCRQNKVVNESLTAELARHKGQVELYEKRARFELTEREQKIDEQLRIIITDRNYKEESLKKELHSTYDNAEKKMVSDKIRPIKIPIYTPKQSKFRSLLFYNGHEIVKTIHALAVLHDSEDTLDVAEKTRIGMLEKMKEHFVG